MAIFRYDMTWDNVDFYLPESVSKVDFRIKLLQYCLSEGLYMRWIGFLITL